MNRLSQFAAADYPELRNPPPTKPLNQPRVKPPKTEAQIEAMRLKRVRQKERKRRARGARDRKYGYHDIRARCSRKTHGYEVQKVNSEDRKGKNVRLATSARNAS